LTLQISKIDGDIKLYFGLLFKMGTNYFAPIYGIYKTILDIFKIKKHIFERTKK